MYDEKRVTVKQLMLVRLMAVTEVDALHGMWVFPTTSNDFNTILSYFVYLFIYVLYKY
jgi:hypothetical protein